MIPQAFIDAWNRTVPWPDDNQIEQDLILSRLIVEIANHELLGPELALRGGTCLHKLHLPAGLRYSEDLDYVRSTQGGFGPYVDALRDVAETGMGLVLRERNFSGGMVRLVFDAEPTSGVGRIRIKIETNIAETEPYEDRLPLPFAVDSEWFRGECNVNTFTVEDLMATKFRALYQRRKGRDLYDLWHVLTDLRPDEGRIVDGLRHYMKEETFTFSDLATNLRDKIAHVEFRDDLRGLVRELPAGYELAAAADLVMERLAVGLDGAPELSHIQGGAWRR